MSYIQYKQFNHEFLNEDVETSLNYLQNHS